MNKIIGYLNETCCNYCIGVFRLNIAQRFGNIWTKILEYYSDSRNGNESNPNINICEELFEYLNIFKYSLQLCSKCDSK